MDNPYSRHKRRWLIKGGSESEEYLNEAIENFNSLVDNMEAPSVHKIKYTLPLDYNMHNPLEENVLISDFNQMESIMDKKALHVKLTSEISSGSIVFWDGVFWLVINEEHKSVLSNKTYTMQKCLININILYDGIQYEYPVYISNLTLYSDGKKELVNLDVSSAKYNFLLTKNKVTETVEVGTRFIIKGRAFEVSLIDDFTNENIRTITVTECVANSLDDLENNIAYNKNSDIAETESPNQIIVGDSTILLGNTTTYSHLYASAWELENNNNILTLVSQKPGSCVIKCTSDSNFIGKSYILQAVDRNGNVIVEKKITIGGLY